MRATPVKPMSLLYVRKAVPLNGGALFEFSFMLDAFDERTANRWLSVMHVMHGARARRITVAPSTQLNLLHWEGEP